MEQHTANITHILFQVKDLGKLGNVVAKISYFFPSTFGHRRKHCWENKILKNVSQQNQKHISIILSLFGIHKKERRFTAVKAVVSSSSF